MFVQTPRLQVRSIWLEQRYQLPKVALVTISFASMVGVYLTTRAYDAAIGWVALRWLHLASLGALAGGMMWQGFFADMPDDPNQVADVARFALAARTRFARLARGFLAAQIISLPSLGWLAMRSAAHGSVWLWGLNVAVLAAALVVVVRQLRSAADPDRVFEGGGARLACGLLVASLAVTAWLDAELAFNGWLAAALLRPTHVTAFGLWFGGAIWNIFISVPSARDTLAYPVVVAAAGELEDFRKTVRVFLPTLLLSGLLQALPYTGWHLAGWTSPIGQLVLVKLGLVAGLVVIFITCPLWRACSPIRGMCDLEDLEGPAATGFTPDRRLDNRGRACAGFVHISRTLEEMAPGQCLELLSTDAISWWELPAWLEKHGHRLLQRQRKGRWPRRYYRFVIEKC